MLRDDSASYSTAHLVSCGSAGPCHCGRGRRSRAACICGTASEIGELRGESALVIEAAVGEQARGANNAVSVSLICESAIHFFTSSWSRSARKRIEATSRAADRFGAGRWPVHRRDRSPFHLLALGDGEVGSDKHGERGVSVPGLVVPC